MQVLAEDEAQPDPNQPPMPDALGGQPIPQGVAPGGEPQLSLAQAGLEQ